MKIYIGNNWNIDFDKPLEMSESQFQKFLNYMNEMYAVVTVEEPSEFRIERMGQKLFFKKWEDSELYYILNPTLTTDELTGMLGRTWMSINIKRGWYMAEFNRWCTNNGKNIFTEDIKSLIKQFMQDKKELFEKKSKQKKEITATKRAIDTMDECAIGTNKYGDECIHGFNKRCTTCPFGRKYIKSEADIQRFNDIYDEFYT